jgi:phage terminase small subunit
MTTLTAKQEAFCLRIVAGDSASDAYRSAYTPKKATAKTINEAASRLARSSKVVARIAELREPIIEKVQADVAYVLDNLVEVTERCMQRAPVMVKVDGHMEQAMDADGNHLWEFEGKTAVAALGLIGKYRGMFTERHEHSGPNGGPFEVKVTHEIVDPAA